MDWIQNLLNGENGDPLQLVLITLFLVICLILIVWTVRRVAGSPARRAGRGRIPRLLITDSAPVDDKRYIVLVRRDNVEHLLLIGGPTDVVVETGIVRVQPVATHAESMRPGTPSAAEKATALTPKSSSTKPSKDQPLFGAAASGAVAVATTADAVATKQVPTSTPAPAATKPETLDVTKRTEEVVEEALETIVPVDDGVSEDPETEASAEGIVAEETVESVEDVAETVEEAVSEVDPAPELEPDLEESITKKLDDALSSEDFNLEADAEAAEPAEAAEAAEAAEPAETAETAEAAVKKEKPDDEMQRLLEELAGESKQSA